MAYVVLAAGAVMVLIGALAIITGYPIIQIERGWTTVIAGTSLLAGGVVTIALSLILRALMDLRHVMEASPAIGAPVFEYTAGTAKTDRSVEPLLDARTDSPAPQSSSWTRETAMLGAAAVAVPVVALALHEAEHTHDIPVAHQAEPVHADHIAEPVPEEQAHEESVKEPAAPRLDDWLDRAFADMPEPVASGAASATTQAEPEPLHPDHAFADDPIYAAHPAAAPATQLHDDHVETHLYEHAAEADVDTLHGTAPTVPALDEQTSAVIGRYEADGTSYTMYADGSIDAQSDVGVYRFSSMAELKAFIEG